MMHIQMADFEAFIKIILSLSTFFVAVKVIRTTSK